MLMKINPNVKIYIGRPRKQREPNKNIGFYA